MAISPKANGKNPDPYYRAQAFARLAGVTVRTLHHYDRLGLLRPERRAISGQGAGYRLYADADLERLEQVVALKFLGFPLRQIGTLLADTALPLGPALRLQRELLEARRELLERAITAIRDAEAAARRRRGRGAQAALLRRIIEVIVVQVPGEDWTRRYYSAAAWARLKARRPAFTPAMQAEASRQWAALMADVEAALGEDPAGPRAQALAARWRQLIEAFTQRDPGVSAGLRKVWAGRARWPLTMREKTAGPRPELFAFIERARQAGEGPGNAGGG